MIDLSDGLATDLRHILDESQVGVSLNPDAIPIHPDCRLFPTSQSEEPWLLLEHAMSDGEDFELCFTLPAEKVEDLMRYAKERHLPIVPIGVVTDRVGQMQWRDGSPVVQAGYTHTFY
jgi:thiamine-monophosphate kinase